MINMYSSTIQLNKDESQTLNRVIGREWMIASQFFYNISEDLSKRIGFKVKLYPSMNDNSVFVIHVESESLSAVGFATDYISNRVFNNWEERK